ncbi:GNAT family N-acetyltransferase [Austwickia chelonae]|uniref:GNAT family N-acetyltransferase n=1 Tax=Austwickia chelonae TaxID=100225 RepID=UPI000E248FBC|nr:GNAT family N-acetyltransferase [Austwickia chelonae]
MYVRAAVPEDAEALTDLHLKVWEEAYSGLIDAAVLAERREGRSARIDKWRTILTGSSSTIFVAQEPDGALAGFISVGPGRDDRSPDLPEREVHALYVRAAKYGTGVGYALLDTAIGAAPAYLWVLDGNERAVGFYERQGFRYDGGSRSDPVGGERRMVRR